MRNRTKLITFIATAATALLPAVASAHHPGLGDLPDVNEHVPPSVERTLGGEVDVTDEGLYRVDLDRGPDLITHGPDTETEMKVAGAGTSTAFQGPGAPERAPVCTLGREASERYMLVIYARQSSSPDNYDASKETIRRQIRRMNWVLNRDSLASGGSVADYRVGCNFPLAEQVIFVGNLTTTGASFNEIVSSAKAAGWTDARNDYTIFFDGEDPTGQACGVGSIHPDERLIADNLNNNPSSRPGADYGVTYRSCWQSNTAMHENGHNQGAVQYGAPHSTGTGWHCWDEIDVMCYSPDGGNLHQQGTETLCSDREYFDCGYDDYFDANPEPGEYLATHWNLGSPLNKFIVFGIPGGATPTADFSYSCVQTTCQFTDRSSDDIGINERQWIMGETGNSQQSSFSWTFPGPGTYQVQLSVRDGRRQWDDITKQVTVTENAQPLTNATPFNDTAGARNSMSLYSIDVPANSRRLRVVLDGPTCRYLSGPCEPNLDLYARRGTDPTRTLFDSSSKEVGADEVIIVRRPTAGTYRIGVDNVYAQPGTNYTITAKIRAG